MGKKNKKNTKINQRIRKYFDDEPFDIGIERVSSETMSELVHTLGIHDVEHKKEVLLKTIRMVWSEADSGFREDILNFFVANGEIYTSDKPKKKTPDRDQKIHELIDELNLSQEEEILLYDAFIEMRSKKITLAKLESKLQHIRFDIKRENLIN